ncbi:MAG: ATP synthase subunit I [Sulfuritalea sp.]|nr:ATP synthase subunit I [Sulfuritalea sp.]
MRNVLLIQAATILVAAAIAGMLGGMVYARSVLIGGGAYFIPNLLFVVRLRIASGGRRVGAVGFMIGAAVKLCAVLALLSILPQLFVVSWPAVIAGLFVVLLVNTLALLVKT